MIIYFNKKTGEIAGTTERRIHDEIHLNMWIGYKKETNRIVVQWKAVKWFDKEGKEVKKDAVDEKGNSIVYAADFEPDTKQKDIFIELDKNPSKVYDYKVDPKSKLLVVKS